MDKKEIENYGFYFARGVLLYIGYLLILGLVILFIYGKFIQGIDDSDISKWKRSGLKIHTDNKTGVQYLSDGHGGLTPRLSKQCTVEDFLTNDKYKLKQQ